MRLKLVMTGLVLVLAALGMAQTMEQPETAAELAPEAPQDLGDDEVLPGQTELAAVAPPPLGLGADLGNSCICVCRQAEEPRAQRWGYYERSIVSGCQWGGRVCVVEGGLGQLGACTESPAPLS